MSNISYSEAGALQLRARVDHRARVVRQAQSALAGHRGQKVVRPVQVAHRVRVGRVGQLA